jgi:hypothetical protein
MEEGRRRKELGLPEVYLYEKDTRAVHYTDFVNKELVLFSNMDNERSIPRYEASESTVSTVFEQAVLWIRKDPHSFCSAGSGSRRAKIITEVKKIQVLKY